MGPFTWFHSLVNRVPGTDKLKCKQQYVHIIFGFLSPWFGSPKVEIGQVQEIEYSIPFI